MAGAPLGQVRARIAQLGAPLVGGRAYGYMPDQLSVGPDGALVVVILPGDTVIEPVTFGGAAYRYRLIARVIVGGTSDEAAQRQLDEKITPDGPGSVWAALETADGMLGLADYLIVIGAENYGEFALDNGRYLSADLMLEVLSNE